MIMYFKMNTLQKELIVDEILLIKCVLPVLPWN